MKLITDLLKNNFSFEYMDKSCSELKKKTVDGYTCLKKLGVGAFGQTYLFKKGTKKIAIKIMNRKIKKEDILNEVSILKKIKKSCKNYLCHKKVIDNYIITEYIDGENMWDYYNLKNVSRKKTFSFILQLFNGLEEIHKLGVIHFDIKPENIMISKNKLKIIDFGGAFYSSDKKKAVQNFYTIGYTPENTKKRMTFKYGVYIDYYCAFKTFRNDDPTIISPLYYVNNVKNVYDLFDTTKLNVRNYRSRIEKIKKIIS